MRRCTVEPRENWQQTVESQGMHYHTSDDGPYWDESVYYEFTSSEIDALEAATYELDKMCLEAVELVVANNRFAEFAVPPEFRQYIADSWERDEHTLYGRFDLAFSGDAPPKLLEYNADTPTALLEAAVIQWHWLQDQFPAAQQFNSIHERLLDAWREFQPDLKGRVYFAGMAEHVEDYMTVNYLRDLAIQAGVDTAYIHVEDIGWDPRRRTFTDLQERPITECFKLYPWEWMQREKFGSCLLANSCRWWEPPWKALLSNKAILAVLWELFPDSPYLLECSFEPLAEGTYVKKPILSREGANIQIFDRGRLFLQTDGPYNGPWVHQAVFPFRAFDDRYFACLGSWMVNGWACGLGVREDESLITGNTSRFVPHIYRP